VIEERGKERSLKVEVACARKNFKSEREKKKKNVDKQAQNKKGT
jgi:hypothetical protein